jgi:tetratricopeptide (TPR) repeat protein
LALLEEDSGREAEAAALYASVLKGRSETLGERHKETVGVRSTLGFLYFAMGRMSEALPLLEGTLECMREEKGNEDADTLTAMKNVAVASRKSGDIARARELYSEILTVREKTLPPSHSLLRRSLDDLADVLLTQKEFSLALPLLERVATLSLSESGEEESLETARVLDSLAFVLEHCGERERAKSVYEDALRITRASVGESHEETAAALARVGDWHAAGDDYAAALAIYRQVLAIRIAALGPHDFDTENARVAIEQWEECL